MKYVMPIAFLLLTAAALYASFRSAAGDGGGFGYALLALIFACAAYHSGVR